MFSRNLAFSILVFAMCFLSIAATSLAADKQTESDAQQVALKAAAFIKEKGVDAGRAAFEADGEFKFGEVYVNVINENGIRLIYPPKPAAVNIDVLEAQDVDGKYLIKDILAVAKT